MQAQHQQAKSSVRLTDRGRVASKILSLPTACFNESRLSSAAE
jgi:hypothetical protein